MSKLQKIYINEPGDESAVIYVKCDEDLELGKNQKNQVLDRVSAGNTINHTVITMKKEMDKVKDVLKCVYDSISSETFSPDELELSMGFELSSTVGAVLVSGDMKASIAVKAVWKK